jgi:tyrosine-protein kinase Etk/Wzc
MDIQTNGRTMNGYVTNKDDDDSIDLKKIIFRILRNWYWFALTVFLALGAAYAYNRYAVPVYQISSSLLVEEDYSPTPFGGGSKGLSQNIFQGLGGMNSMQNIFNQIVVLSSTPGD